MMAMIMKRVFAGLMTMAGVFASTQSMSAQPAPVQSEKARYEVVLGSYVSRDIALRELAEFSTCKQPIFIRPISRNNDGDVRTMYRVVDGPLSRFDEAQIFVGLWLECGVEDAWIDKL